MKLKEIQVALAVQVNNKDLFTDPLNKLYKAILTGKSVTIEENIINEDVEIHISSEDSIKKSDSNLTNLDYIRIELVKHLKKVTKEKYNL